MNTYLGFKFESSEHFNTNNAWGFGGGVGTSYKFKNNIEVRDGIAYYRHAPSIGYVAVWVDGYKVLDVHTSEHNKVKEVLSKLLN